MLFLVNPHQIWVLLSLLALLRNGVIFILSLGMGRFFFKKILKLLSDVAKKILLLGYWLGLIFGASP